MKVPFTWKPTGWFMIGLSAEFEPGTVKPLKYFGQDLVAYRTEDGELHVLDAHCPHLGAHLGHRRQGQRRLRRVPVPRLGLRARRRQQVHPVRGPTQRLQVLRAWPVKEQHEWVFMWHDPAGGAATLGPADRFGTLDRCAGRPGRLLPGVSGALGQVRPASRCIRRSRSRTLLTRCTSSTCTTPRWIRCARVRARSGRSAYRAIGGWPDAHRPTAASDGPEDPRHELWRRRLA